MDEEDRSCFSFLRQFDCNPAYVNINFKGKKTHKSLIGGSISCLFVFSILFVLIIQFVYLFSQSNVIFETRISKDTFDQIELKGIQLAFSMKNIDKQPIPLQQFREYGVKVVLQIKSQGRGGIGENSIISLQACQQKDGKLSKFRYCVANRQQEKMKVKGRKDVKKQNEFGQQVVYQEIRLVLKQQNNTNMVRIREKSDYFYPSIQFNNHVINQQNKTIDQAIYDNQLRYFETIEPLSFSFNEGTLEYIFQIKKVEMTTDYSILPTSINTYLDTKKEQKNESWFFGQQFTSQSYFRRKALGQPQIFVACFKRSMYTNSYIRHFVKLDTVLAQSFGMIGFLSFLLFFLYRGYNQWLLEKQIIGKNHNFNIFDYYKDRFVSSKQWLASFLCCFKSKKNENKIELQDSIIKNRRNLSYHLDIGRSRLEISHLKNKIKNLEKALQEMAIKTGNYEAIKMLKNNSAASFDGSIITVNQQAQQYSDNDLQ